MPASFTKHRPRYQPTFAPRPSAARRGYGTDWKKLREEAKRTGACGPYLCSVPGCGKARSLHLDHIVPRERGGRDVFSNLHWLCHSHHSSKTAKTDGGFGNSEKR
jgi:5-methylcytosine-specific restriction protein A